MKHTEEQHIELGGKDCPFCGHDKIESIDSWYPADGNYAVEMQCLECENKWTDEYDLVGVQFHEEEE